eukprot:m.69080 g.69080  ORF g.69080 m.69080 type:complete len:195 (-) comp50034_c0_seq1:1142-1726(-)
MAEPADKPDRALRGKCPHATRIDAPASDSPEDAIPASIIPAAGRGNSEDGKHWLNPSANQLHRALQRKDKPIEQADALAVAHMHEMITNGTWDAILEYEAFHAEQCDNPRLSRFHGMDGRYSPKARIMNLFGVNLPYDRHDWIVDRCGKEVRYTIDYYDRNSVFTIDARPAGLVGCIDRVRLAFKKIGSGQMPW